MAIDTMSARESIMPPATKEDFIILLLEELVRGRQEEQGKSPNLIVTEFDLLTLTTRVVTCDFLADRWVIYARPNTTSRLRVALGGSVPTLNAFECNDGKRLIISQRNQQISIYNADANTAHVFAVAVGGGAEFDVLT